MSLIPYHPREGREIVLRHRNTVVIRNPDSQRLEIRRQACPTCHQLLPQAKDFVNNHGYDRPYEDPDDSFVDPAYFRMLGRGSYNYLPAAGRTSQSPGRSLPRPDDDSGPGGFRPPEVMDDEDEDLDMRPEPSTQRRGSRIRREAFSPNYFKSFFKEERVLGKGGKGVVFLVSHELNGVNLGHFACKRVPVGDDSEWLEKALVEVGLLAKLSHPNLVSFRHVWLEDVRLSVFGPPVVCAYILQQYCNGRDLQYHVVGEAPTPATNEERKARRRRLSKGQPETPNNVTGNKSQLELEEIYPLFRDITSGVAYLHAANYIHRDLKPSNCLLHHENASVRCLISDFGEVQVENAARKSSGSTGTISYCAPEVLKLDPATGCFGNFTTKSDMFSLGMILHFMCFGKLPYRSANAIQEELEDVELLRAEISDWEGFKEERRERADLPPKLYTVLEQMLSLDPAQRPSANEVLHYMKSETNFDTRANLPKRSNRAQSIVSSKKDAVPSTNQGSRLNRNLQPWVTSEDPDSSAVLDLADDQVVEQSLTVAHRDVNIYDDGSTTSTPRSVSPPRRMSQDRLRQQRTPTTPLLPAPPRSHWEEIEHRVSVALYYWGRTLGVDAQSLVYDYQLVVFIVKAATLARPCWPYVPSLQVGAPLLVVATLELLFASSPVSHGSRLRGQHYHIGGLFQAPCMGLVLFTFHFATVWLAGRWDVLCTHGPRQECADW